MCVFKIINLFSTLEIQASSRHLAARLQPRSHLCNKTFATQVAHWLHACERGLHGSSCAETKIGSMNRMMNYRRLSRPLFVSVGVPFTCATILLKSPH
uniref:Uncharacterized protein n=1 Tax=Anopheles atroparvus TaxID=41427 RepID=A0AAG5DA25_ANOAO